MSLADQAKAMGCTIHYLSLVLTYAEQAGLVKRGHRKLVKATQIEYQKFLDDHRRPASLSLSTITEN